MKQIVSNVFVNDRHSLSETYRGCTYGMVSTTEGVVLVDSPMMPTDAVAWNDAATAYGRCRYLVNTHHHLDHTAGNYFFSATGIAHRHTKRLFDTPTELFTAPERDDTDDDVGERASGEMELREYVRLKVQTIDPEALPLLEGYHVGVPSIYISGSATLSVGDHTFELIHTPGHTPGDIGVYVLENRVYFAGDTVTNGEYPSLASSDPFEWLASLQRIQSLDIDVVVPGHGRIGDASMVRRFSQFLERCIERVRDAVEAGLTREETCQSVSFDDGLSALHTGERRRQRDVAAVYDAVLAA